MEIERLAITGGNGALGRALVAAFEQDFRITSIDVTPGCPGVRARYADVRSMEATREALRSHDAVIHAAALLRPDDPPDKMFEVNVVGTWNVLRAASELGIRRVVLISSECASGIINIRGSLGVAPEYLPVDEHHPLRPTDTYGLSKKLAEEIARRYALCDMRIVVLRPTLILMPGMEEHVKRIRTMDDPDLWSYVEICDVVHATRLALEYEGPRFDAFYLSAQDTFSAERTLGFIERKFGTLPQLRDASVYEHNPHAAIWDLSRVRTLLGLEPRSSWRRFIEHRGKERPAGCG